MADQANERADAEIMDTDPNDPAEFLLTESRYHDCYLTVGNPETDQVEKIGVSSTHLIAHSSVFRKMLVDSKLADPSGSNTVITDVSPATFKLLLRHVYGGKLPKLNNEEAMALALCGDKYNIQYLVEKAAKELKPTNAEDVFPALICASFINCPDLELQVSKIIQEESRKLVCSKRFLELDENSLILIAKQETLNISEVELWQNLLYWAENQVQKDPEKTLRKCLNKVLQHVRVLTFTVEDIVKQLSNVLSEKEFFELVCSVIKNETLQSPGLCQIKQNRYLNFKTTYCFNLNKACDETNFKLKQDGTNNLFSTFKIESTVTVRIDSFIIDSKQHEPENKTYNNHTYKLECTIAITKSANALPLESYEIKIERSYMFNDEITLPIRLDDGKPLILERGNKYTVMIKFNTAHPVYRIYKITPAKKDNRGNVIEKKTSSVCCGVAKHFPSCTSSYIRVKYEDHPHVKRIVYKVSN